jgi:hypothetical protein
VLFGFALGGLFRAERGRHRIGWLPRPPP